MKSGEWAAAEPPLAEKDERPAAEPPGTVAGIEGTEAEPLCTEKGKPREQ